MATQHRIHPKTGRTDGSLIPTHEEPVRDLLKQLAGEGSDLLRNEMALAKLEMRDMAREVAMDSAKLFAAIGLALVGGLTLVAAAVIALGNLLDGMYALSALIIGIVLLAIGGLMARGGAKGLKTVHGPRQTIQSLKNDKAWAAAEARQFKEEIKS